jgi:CelD/BcsL family acetyltransferase involved in cellulose biosynthesis
MPQLNRSPDVRRIEIITDEAGFDALRDEWDWLLAQSDQRVFFLRHDWIHRWWRIYAPPGSRLCLVTCRDDDDRLIGLAPLYWHQRTFAGFPHVRELLFIGTGTEIKTSEYLDLIAASGCEEVIGKAVASVLSGRPDWDRLFLWSIPADSKVLPYFHRALGDGTSVVCCDRMPYISTQSDWETVKSGMGSKLRSRIDYYQRKLDRAYPYRFERIEAAGQMEAVMDEFVRLHQARWQSKGESGSFTLPHFENFLRESMRQGLADGRLRLWTLTINDQCAAVLMAYVDSGVAHYFQGGFDPVYGRFSLGSVMLALCIRDCLGDADIHAFDFMGGAAPYKDAWTKTAREAVELELIRPGLRPQLYQAAKRGRRMAAGIWHLLKRHLGKITSQTT